MEKTSFSMPSVNLEQSARGLVAVDGLIIGEIHGSVNGIFRGTIDGDVDVRLLSGKMTRAAMSSQRLLPEKQPDEAAAVQEEGAET